MSCNMYLYRNLLSMCSILAVITCGGSAETEFCESVEQTINYTTIGSIVTITSSNYSQSDDTTLQPRVINIHIEPWQEVGFHIEQQNSNLSSGSEWFEYIQVLNTITNAPLPVTTCDSENRREIYGLLRQNQSDIRVELAAGLGPGFTFNFTALPLHTMRFADAAEGSTSSPSGYIISHEAFNFTSSEYDNTLNSIFIITDIREATEITIDFIYFNLGSYETCQPSGDIFTLLENRSDTVIHQLFYNCEISTVNSSTQRTFVISNLTTSLMFELKRNATYGSFLLRYSVNRDTTTATKLKSAVPSSRTCSQPVSQTSKFTSNSTRCSTNYGVTSKESSTPSSTSGPSKLMTFFKNDSNIIAVAAGGGGLVLVIIIVVLTAVIACRRSKVRGRDSVEEVRHQDEPLDGFIQINLEPVPNNSSIPAATERRGQSQANRYSDVDLVPDTSPSSPEKEDVMSHPQNAEAVPKEEGAVDHNSNAELTFSDVRKEPEGEEGQNIEDSYAIVDKTKKVTMIDNDLYGSRDSLSSNEEGD